MPLLDSLRIQNFRTFRDLTVDRLGRVNLIVGKNNVGKTALLEAVYAWAKPSVWGEFVHRVRSEIPVDRSGEKRDVIENRLDVIRTQIFDRPDELWRTAIQIGPNDDMGERVWTAFFDRKWDWGPHERVQLESVDVPYLGVGHGSYEGPDLEAEGQGRDQPNGKPNGAGNPPVKVYSIWEGEADVLSQTLDRCEVQFVHSHGLVGRNAKELWEQLVKAGHRKRALELVGVLLPETESIEWVNESSLSLKAPDQEFGLQKREQARPIPLLETGEGKPKPISMYGDGVSHALGIAIALLNSEDGVLVIDEFENGLHHSVQRDLWDMIFETARDLNVQVFATTHSRDCVEAFERVAGMYDREKSALVSLRRSQKKEGEVVAIVSDKEEMQTMADTGIEVR